MVVTSEGRSKRLVVQHLAIFAYRGLAWLAPERTIPLQTRISHESKQSGVYVDSHRPVREVFKNESISRGMLYNERKEARETLISRVTKT